MTLCIRGNSEIARVLSGKAWITLHRIQGRHSNAFANNVQWDLYNSITSESGQVQHMEHIVEK